MKSHAGVLAALLAAAAFSSCKRESPRAAEKHPAVVSVPNLQKQFTAAFEQLSKVRGLAIKRPVALNVIPATEYRRRLIERNALLIGGPDPRIVEALWSSLNFAHVSATPSSIAQQIIDDSQVDAFYDSSTASVVLKQPESATYDPAGSVAVITALETALQEQHFGAAPTSIGLAIDDRLTQIALREGDATAASVAYFATRDARPTVEAVSRVASVLDSLPVDALVTSVGFARGLTQAPILVRDELSRAQPAGLQLVAALLRTGGFALVDRALANPPSSMFEMYGPQFYVRGWQPMRWTKAEHATRLGVIGLVAFIERCQPTARAKIFVPDWRGDAFSLLTTSPPVFVWQTTWKDDAAATRFADEVSGNAQCRAPGTNAAVHFEVLRRGSVVVVSNSSETSVVDKSLASAVVPTKRPPPLGDANLELSVAVGPQYAGHSMLDVARAGKLRGNKYDNPRLGFSAEIPSGFDTNLDEILAIDHPPPSLASGRVAFEQSDAPFTTPADFFSQFAKRIATSLFAGAPLSETSSGDMQTAFGRAPYRQYEMRGGRLARVCVVALPICKGAAALVVALVSMDTAGHDLLNGWLRSFRPTSATVCSSLTGQ